MIAINQLAVARVGDVPAGELIAFRQSDSYGYGIAVRAPGPKAPGLLLLTPPGHGREPLYTWSNDYCLRVGTKPTIQWSGKPGSLSAPSQKSPPVGHLVVMGGSHLISGRVPHLGGTDPVYWDLATGEVAQIDYSTAIYVSEWCLGTLSNEGKFTLLFSFEAPE